MAGQHRLAIFFFGILVIGSGLLTNTGRAAPAREGARPNFVWILAEDIAPDLACFGDSYSISPNLDKLASEGARYTNAFSISGVCAPSRSALITGMYPTTIGTHHMRSAGVPPPYVKCFTEYLRAAGYYCSNNAKTDYNFFANASDTPLSAWDDCSRTADWRGRDPDQPFFAQFTLAVSHESQIRANEAAFARNTQSLRPEDRHDPAKATLPPYYPDTPEVRRDWARYHDLITAMDIQVGGLLKRLEEDNLADSTIVFFFGDNGRGLPRGKRWLYDAGIHVPLIIRWPGAITPGSVPDRLVSFIDFPATVLSLAGIEPPKTMQGKPFLGEYDTPPRQFILAARDRMDETYDIIRAVRDKQFKYIRNFQPEKTYAQPIAYMDEMPTMKVWRRLNAEGRLAGPQKLFFAATKPVEELYDTLADPHEVNNLAADPDFALRRSEMGKKLEAWMKETNDLALVPEPELLERMRPGGIWATTKKPEIQMRQNGAEPRISISCPTEGASIVYTFDQDASPRWKLYSQPFDPPSGGTLRVRACRLGYNDSDEARLEITRK